MACGRVVSTNPVLVEHDYGDNPPGGVVLQNRMLVRVARHVRGDGLESIYLEDSARSRSISPGDMLYWLHPEDEGALDVEGRDSGRPVFPANAVFWRPWGQNDTAWGEKGWIRIRRFASPQPITSPQMA